MPCTFQTTVGGKFAPLISLRDDDTYTQIMITTNNIAVTDTTASETLRKECCWKKPWLTRDVFDIHDERRDLKKRRYEAEGAKEYRKQAREFRRQ